MLSIVIVCWLRFTIMETLPSFDIMNHFWHFPHHSWGSKTSNWAILVGRWMGGRLFCPSDFSGSTKRHEFQNLLANSTWCMVDSHLIFLSYLYFFSKKKNRIQFFVIAISQDLQIVWISNFTCEEHLAGVEVNAHLFLYIFFVFFTKIGKIQFTTIDVNISRAASSYCGY